MKCEGFTSIIQIKWSILKLRNQNLNLVKNCSQVSKGIFYNDMKFQIIRPSCGIVVEGSCMILKCDYQTEVNGQTKIWMNWQKDGQTDAWQSHPVHLHICPWPWPLTSHLKQILRIVVPNTATNLTLKYRSKVKVTAQCQWKGLVKRIKHAKYQCSIDH